MQPKDKHEADVAGAGKTKTKKKDKHRAPLHERVRGDVYNLLNYGQVREGWKKSHREHRNNIATAFCIALVKKEAERVGVVKRTRSVELRTFEALPRERRLELLCEFLVSSRLDLATSDDLVARATWPRAFCGDDERQGPVLAPLMIDAREQLKPNKRFKTIAADDDDDDDDEMGMFEEEPDDSSSDGDSDSDADGNGEGDGGDNNNAEFENSNDDGDDDDEEDEEEEEDEAATAVGAQATGGSNQPARQKKVRRPCVVAVFPGSKANFSAPMLLLDGAAMQALLAQARDRRVEVRKAEIEIIQLTQLRRSCSAKSSQSCGRWTATHVLCGHGNIRLALLQISWRECRKKQETSKRDSSSGAPTTTTWPRWQRSARSSASQTRYLPVQT